MPKTIETHLPWLGGVRGLGALWVVLAAVGVPIAHGCNRRRRLYGGAPFLVAPVGTSCGARARSAWISE